MAEPRAAFQKKLAESKTVGFDVKLPPGTVVQGDAEFIVHAYSVGEDGLRMRGLLQSGPPTANPLQQLLALYKARIPKGISPNGPVNNIRSVTNPKYIPYTCGGYQKQVLLFLDRLRFSKVASERALVANLEYGPVEGSCGGHQAVVIYESGKDWTTGIVLDPWPNQKPEWMPVQQWAGIYRLARPSGAYSGSAANYPILGGMYRDPDIGSGRYTPEELQLLKSLPPDHYQFQAKLDDYARRVWMRGALQRFRTQGKLFVKCPVAARLVDQSGRYTGLKGNELANPIPGTEVLLHPWAENDNWMQFGFDPGAGLKLELDPLGPEEAQLEAFNGSQTETLKVALATGQRRTVTLNPLKLAATAEPPPVAPDTVIFHNMNSDGVTQGSPRALTLQFPQTVKVTEIQTYHWNGGTGAQPGTISLVGNDGKVYGPWTARPDGQNTFWTSRPGVILTPGTYTLKVSNPASWSYNTRSEGQGFATIRGRLVQAASVREVEQTALAGNFRLTDTARTPEQYHADVRFLPDGTGWVREFQNNKPMSGRYPNTADAQGYYPVLWSYDRHSGRFSLDWTLGGRLAGLGSFEGTTQGSVDSFTLGGHWSSGKGATIRLDRIR